MDKGRFRPREGRSIANGQDARRMVLRRPRHGLQECRACLGRDICDAGHEPPDARNPHRYGLLAERQSPRLHRYAEHGADSASNRNMVLISEYTGGGVGSKITGGVTLGIPALLPKKVNAPVMMRISREEETFIGRARPSLMGRMKVGFSKEGRVIALDMFVISNNGPYDANGDVPSSGRIVSLLYQCEAMRWRGATILTNTPPRSAQSSPGGMQGIAIMEPVIAKAARKL